MSRLLLYSLHFNQKQQYAHCFVLFFFFFAFTLHTGFIKDLDSEGGSKLLSLFCHLSPARKYSR
jgi:hypothetical protein